jgi:hypothetical protein
MYCRLARDARIDRRIEADAQQITETLRADRMAEQESLTFGAMMVTEKLQLRVLLNASGNYPSFGLVAGLQHDPAPQRHYQTTSLGNGNKSRWQNHPQAGCCQRTSASALADKGAVLGSFQGFSSVSASWRLG